MSRAGQRRAQQEVLVTMLVAVALRDPDTVARTLARIALLL